ncbi:MAG: hypothetical protein M3Q03_02730 [Chloroflexota bacterium]|nr:hypothetical protein [Chloroflexota bacterium]
MPTEIVDLAQLSGSETAKHGRRYTEVEKEAAYQIYRSVAGRSTAKTARLTGIAERTLDNWRHDHGWAARAEQEAREAAELWSGALSLVVREQAFVSVLTAAQLRDDPATPPKVRLDASIWLAGLAGAVPLTKTATLTQQVPAPAVPTTPAPTTYDHATDTPRPFDPANPDPSLPLTREQALAMTPEQRQAWEQAYRQRPAG